MFYLIYISYILNRWKNIDDNDENERKMDSDEEQNVGEEEVEDAEWRKQRYEREKFLQEQQAKVIKTVINMFLKGKYSFIRNYMKM